LITANAETEKAPAVKSKILVVDDNRDVCRTVADMLSATGARILTAFNGSEALGLCRPGDHRFIVLRPGLQRHRRTARQI
jgi:DNA-binding response OmpR family regulator